MLSITVRPRESNFRKEWREKLAGYFDKYKMPYVIGIEKSNHLQCAVETSKRSNNMRTAIIRVLGYVPEDDTEKLVWLKIVSHNNPQYLIGYCMKETEYITNIEQPKLMEYEKYYISHKNKIQESKKYSSWLCTGINSLIPVAYEYAKEEGIENRDFKSIVNVMAAQSLIPFSLSRKIKSQDNPVYALYVRIKEEESGVSAEELIISYENKMLALDI